MDRPKSLVTPQRFAQAAVDEILSVLHERIVVGRASTGGA